MGRGKNSATVRRQLSNLLKVFCNPFSLLSPFSVVSWWYVKCCSMQYVKQFSYGLMFPFSSFFFVFFVLFWFSLFFFFNSMYGVTLNVCGVMYWVVTVCVMETFCILSSGTGLKWDLKFHRSHHTFIQPSCQKPFKKKKAHDFYLGATSQFSYSCFYSCYLSKFTKPRTKKCQSCRARFLF